MRGEGELGGDSHGTDSPAFLALAPVRLADVLRCALTDTSYLGVPFAPPCCSQARRERPWAMTHRLPARQRITLILVWIRPPDKGPRTSPRRVSEG